MKYLIILVLFGVNFSSFGASPEQRPPVPQSAARLSSTAALPWGLRKHQLQHLSQKFIDCESYELRKGILHERCLSPLTEEMRLGMPPGVELDDGDLYLYYNEYCGLYRVSWVTIYESPATLRLRYVQLKTYLDEKYTPSVMSHTKPPVRAALGNNFSIGPPR